MKKEAPDFYLSSTEHSDFAIPRACWIKKKMFCSYAKDNKDGLWMEVNPPISGQGCGFGNKDIVDLIIYARYQGASLFPVNEWPLYINIFCIQNSEILKTGRIENPEDVKLWAWAELNKSLKKITT